MSKVDVKISLDVLNSLSPQKGMLNAPIKELENQVFNLHSMVAPKDGSAKLDGVAGADTMMVRARYVNAANGKSFLIPIRGLLNLGIVELGGNTPYEETDEEPTKVHEWLMEHIKDGAKSYSLPDSFKVVSVKPREQKGTGHIMYPPYCYEAFNAKVDELRKDDPNAVLDPIYNDFDFMTGLYGTKLGARFTSAEPNKDLVISI